MFRGREVKTTGDGVLAVFDSPARAVGCAVAMTRSTRQIGVEIRVGVHTGEIEAVGDDVRGIAVHTAARVTALAGAGEVLVSATTAGLLEGSSVRLEDAGTHELKGIDGPASCSGWWTRRRADDPTSGPSPPGRVLSGLT